MVVTGTMSNKGVVKITFSREIHLPWYMIVSPKASKVGDSETIGDGKKGRLLFKELEYYLAERKKKKKRKLSHMFLNHSFGDKTQANN